MKSPISVLIVEDRANHITDCKVMLEKELPRLPIQVNVLWASNLEEGLRLLPQADAVMTDVFFPNAPGASDEEPNGQIVVEHCLRESKPVVWVTSTYHHGAKTNAISQWGRERGLEMFDRCPSEIPGENPDGEASNKPWKCALYGLFCLILSFEDGACTVFEGRIHHKESVDDHPEECRKPFGHIFTVRGFDVASFFWHGGDEYGDYYPALKKMVSMGFPRP